MALTRTLAQIRERVQRAAGVLAFTDRHPTAYIDDLINGALGALLRTTATVAPEFRPIASTTITFDGTNTAYALPSGFRSAILVEYIGDDAHRAYLGEYTMAERPRLADVDAASDSIGAVAFRLLGSNIDFLPLPPSGHTAVLWYATTATQLSSGSDTTDVVDRVDDYITWWAAREVAMDREDWERHDRLTAKLDAAVPEILIMARQRNVSGPSRPVNLYAVDRYGRRVRS